MSVQIRKWPSLGGPAPETSGSTCCWRGGLGQRDEGRTGGGGLEAVSVWKGQYMPHPEKGWKGLGDELDVGMDDIYPVRTKHLSLLLSSLGESPQKNDVMGKAEQHHAGGLNRLPSLCSEIVAHRAPPKAIVSLICPGTGGGRRELSVRRKQKLPFQAHCCSHLGLE